MKRALLSLSICCVVRAASGDDSPQAPPKDPFLGDLPKVEAAALHTQTLDEAPADVTIITRAQMRTYGYRTLGDVLAGVRGFYLSNDHIYQYAGVAGFSLPGDFNTRFLVMINSHIMTDNIYATNGYFEQDLGLDMDLVERIEVVRGPSSALYGSNGIFATVNLITISPVDFPTVYVSTETGTLGEKKALLAGSFYLGKGANLLISGSGFNNTGQHTIPFPELNGAAIDADGERGYHTFANLVWGNWNIVAFFNARVKQVPLAFEANANNFALHGNHQHDSRNFISANYRRTIGRGELRWETSFDSIDLESRFDLIQPIEGTDDYHIHGDGDWLTSRASYQFTVPHLGSLTAGLDASVDLRNHQYDMVEVPFAAEIFSVNRLSRSAAVFIQDEKRLGAHWKLDLGARFDEHRYYGSAFSPRAVLAYQPTQRTVYKWIYGRSFRDPSAFEQFYHDGLVLQAPPLKPEIADTYEFSAQHHFKPGLTGTVSLYDFQMKRLILGVYNDDGTRYFDNLEGARSRGVEFELDGKPLPWFEADGSFAWQKANPEGDPNRFPNSPAYLAKFRGAVPAGRRLTLSNGYQWISSRSTYSGDTLRDVVLADLTLTVRVVSLGCDLQAGVRNAFNWSYPDPIGLSLDELRADRRSAFVKLTWNARQ